MTYKQPDTLRAAAQAVVERWDAPLWKDVPATAEYIGRLRAALAAPQQEVQEPVADIGSEWTPCVKLPITVHVREQRQGETHVSTREGITPVRPDDLIMRGVAGEEYPIGRELFNRTYRLGAEPVAWLDKEINCAYMPEELDGGTGEGLGLVPLYTTPQQGGASVASKAVLAAIRAANFQLVRTGDDAFMLVTLKQAEAQQEVPKRTVTYVCPVCAASLETQE